MTDLLDAPSLRDRDAASGNRPPVLSAVVAGAAAAMLVLATCQALALAGWFAADAGAYGDTRDALRIGADAWLLAHGSRLALDGATIAVLPLGLTALCALACWRLGRWVGSRGRAADPRALVTGALLFASGYVVVSAVTAVLAFHETAQPNLARALVGGFVLALLAGGPGVVAGAGALPLVRDRSGAPARSVLLGAASVVLLTVTAGAVLLATALVADFGTAANVLARLPADAPDAFLYTVLVAAFVPNAVGLGVAYLLGPGFAVGAGTVVSPTAVVLGPVPALPLIAALPDEGATPEWATALLVVPAVLGAVGVGLALKRSPAPSLATGGLFGLGAGVLAAVVLASLATLAGGAVGPGRMAVVGTPFWDVLAAAVVSVAPGGLVGGLVAAWWARR